jgi:hypothetical protein
VVLESPPDIPYQTVQQPASSIIGCLMSRHAEPSVTQVRLILAEYFCGSHTLLCILHSGEAAFANLLHIAADRWSLTAELVALLEAVSQCRRLRWRIVAFSTSESIHSQEMTLRPM